MNSLVPALNGWGGDFFRFAWPMLWQSSLLIGIIFLLEFALRRKLRASVRYALWLVILVKLLLPPSLALPTSAAWWLRPQGAVPVRPCAASFVVTYGPGLRPFTPMTAPVFLQPTEPRLSAFGWALLTSNALSLGLLAAMLIRWRQVARNLRRTGAAGAFLAELLASARRQAGLLVQLRRWLKDTEKTADQVLSFT